MNWKIYAEENINGNIKEFHWGILTSDNVTKEDMQKQAERFFPKDENFEIKYIERNLMKVNLKPYLNRILVKPITEEKTEAGLVLPKFTPDAKDFRFELQRGKIVSYGDGNILQDGRTLPLNFKVGDVVFYMEAMRMGEIVWEGEKYHILRDIDVLVIEV